jgi:hypothetical protein
VKSDKTLRKWYIFINRRFYDNQLPDNVCVRWADETEEKEVERWEEKYFGWANKCDGDYADGYHTHYIVLSRLKNEAATTRMSTLAHEMIHIATNCRDDHGPAFEKWRLYISDRGIFKKHAVRKGLTIF